MIVLFTDFGWQGPYVGQMKAVLQSLVPVEPVVDLMHDAPAFAPHRAAYLLAAYTRGLHAQTVVVAVVDPGVGTERAALLVEADGRRFLGPDNGLLAIAARQAGEVRAWELEIPRQASSTFHGRDVFAPAAAQLKLTERPPGELVSPERLVGWDWPLDLPEVVYVDAFGNAVTGLRGGSVPAGATLRVGQRRLQSGRTFGAVEPGESFWYVNSSGLVEFAVNQGSAAESLGAVPGADVGVELPEEG